QIKIGDGPIRVELDRRGKIAFRLGKLPLVEMSVPEAKVGIRVFGIDGKDLFVRSDSVRISFVANVVVADTPAAERAFRVEPHRRSVADIGVVKTPLGV